MSLLGIGVVSWAIGGSLKTTRSSFTATTVNSGNTFAAGTLTMSNGGSCTAVVLSNCGTLTLSANTTGLLAGTTATGTITITNSGSLPALMKVNTQNVTGTLASYLNMTIHDDTANYCVYGAAASPGTDSGPGACAALAGLTAVDSNFQFMNLSNLSVPGIGNTTRWASGEAAHTFTVTVELITTGLPAGGAQASIDLVWSSSQ